MHQHLSPDSIAIVKATVPGLTEHGAAITQVMHRRRFENKPTDEVLAA